MAEKSLAGRADLDASGEAVRWFRQEADLTQAEVAEQMAEYGFPWHTSTVSKTESGARDMSVSELIALAEVLGTTASELVEARETITFKLPRLLTA